jgi:hypothetical protein
MRYAKLLALAAALAAGPAAAQGLIATHRIPAGLANEAVMAAVAKCASQTYAESAVLVDADGVRQAVLRGDKAGSHTLDSAYRRLTRPTRPPRSKWIRMPWSSARKRSPVFPTCSRNCRI